MIITPFRAVVFGLPKKDTTAFINALVEEMAEYQWKIVVAMDQSLATLKMLLENEESHMLIYGCRNDACSRALTEVRETFPELAITALTCGKSLAGNFATECKIKTASFTKSKNWTPEDWVATVKAARALIK